MADNFIEHSRRKGGQESLVMDNQSAIRTERNRRKSCNGNSCHIDIQYFFVKDRVQSGEIDIKYCPTENEVANFFAKPIQSSAFKRFRDFMMGHLEAVELSVKGTNQSSLQKIKERVGK